MSDTRSSRAGKARIADNEDTVTRAPGGFGKDNVLWQTGHVVIAHILALLLIDETLETVVSPGPGQCGGERVVGEMFKRQLHAFASSAGGIFIESATAEFVWRDFIFHIDAE